MVVHRRLLVLSLVSAAAFVAACSDGSSRNAEAVRSQSAALDSSLQILGSNICAVNGTRMSCTVPERVLQGESFLSAVPVRTVVRTVISSPAKSCDVTIVPQLPLQLDQEAPTNFAFLRDGSITLTRRDRQPATSLTVRDQTPSISRGVFKPTCVASLQISWNEPDVNSADEARAILAQIEADVAVKKSALDSADRVALQAGALRFLRAAANNFQTELSAPALQELRDSAVAAITVVANGSACASSVDDLQIIAKIITGLTYLGSDSAVVDGGHVKTLEEFMGPEAAAALARLRALEAERADAGVTDEDTLRQAKRQYEEALDKLARAKVQLASWLG